jgi:hypothetical protein
MGLFSLLRTDVIDWFEDQTGSVGEIFSPSSATELTRRLTKGVELQNALQIQVIISLFAPIEETVQLTVQFENEKDNIEFKYSIKELFTH